MERTATDLRHGLLSGAAGPDVLVRAVEAAPQAVCLSDVLAPDQPLVRANHAFTEVTGYPLAEAVGRNCRFLQEGLTARGLDTRGPAARIRAVVAAGAAGTVVVPNRRRDGRCSSTSCRCPR